MEITPICPVCSDSRPKAHLLSTPYWQCERCRVAFQNPMPSKKFEADEEKGEDGRSKGHKMSDKDREVVDLFAYAWSHNWIKKVPTSGAPKVLDIGSKYPWFAHRVQAHSGALVYGLDAMDQDTPGAPAITTEYSADLGVPMLLVDFERVTAQEILGQTEHPELRFAGISMIHVFEHIYDPLQALQQVRALIQDKGSFLVRMPDYTVPGAEAHMSPRHYSVHPFFWCEDAFRMLNQRAGRFDIIETYPLNGYGARDYLLAPRWTVPEAP